MSIELLLNQSSASLRCVPLPPLVQSNGTSACTNESGRTFFFSLGGVDYGAGGFLSVISANAGLYSCNFSASKLSVTGQGFVYYSSGTALPAATPIQVVTVDSLNSQDYGLAAFSVVTVKSITAGTYSGVTLGVNNLAPGTYSGVTVGTNNIAAGSYSGVTIQGVSNTSAAKDIISDITTGVWYAGTRSGVTIQGLSNYANLPAVSIAAGAYSGVTIQGLSNYGNLPTVGITPGTYSDVSVSVRAGGIAASSFQAAAHDAASLATDFVNEIADGLLGRNIAGGSSTGRTVSEALYPLRNRVAISGSTGTVYAVDDTTSAWTFSVSTVAAVGITDLNPAG